MSIQKWPASLFTFHCPNESHEYTQFQTQGMWSDVAGLMWNTCEKSSAQYKNVGNTLKINVSGIRDPWGMSKKSTQDRLSDGISPTIKIVSNYGKLSE